MIAQFTALRKFPGHNTGKGRTGKVQQTPRVEEKEPTVQTDQESLCFLEERTKEEKTVPKIELQRLEEGLLQVLIRMLVRVCI